MSEDGWVENRIVESQAFGDESKPVVLLLHGWGSNEHDLIGLAPLLPNEFRYVSLRGPLTAPPGFGWFRLQFIGADNIIVHDHEVGAEAVAAWCDEHNVTPVGAVGFSQGGATALQLLRAAWMPSLEWAAVLGGFVIGPVSGVTEPDPRDVALAARKPFVFWGRGEADAIISQSRVAELDEWLDEHATAEKHAYPGLTHSVNQAEIDDLSAWMLKRLTAAE